MGSKAPYQTKQMAQLLTYLKTVEGTHVTVADVCSYFKEQGITIGTADDMWKVLASGNFTADADTIAKAKEDISEDGYWGVKQTSSRIFDFAMALAGDDEEKMQKMKAAVEKGFKLATKSWGKELPDISKNTYSAVMDKFDDYFASKKTSTDTE